MKKTILLFIFLAFSISATSEELTYPIVDTGQETCYDNNREINPPEPGEPFYGQDAQFERNAPNYRDNGDGTVTDLVTGLMWQKSADFDGDGEITADDKKTYAEALADAEAFELGGYDDWRLPTIKELYSLFDAGGTDPSGPFGADAIPFIDSDFFTFGYGDESAGERDIDAQYATSTIYEGTVFGNATAMFGVNFADGRIKGYPIESSDPNGSGKTFYVKYVRGSTAYGENEFVDNGDGTITDKATELTWSKEDSKRGLNWEEALAWVNEKNAENYLGRADWRLPNVKELQSIVDYSRSPSFTNSAAIDPVFECSEIVDEGGEMDFPFYWSSTTHKSVVQPVGASAMYVAFGEALGFMEIPPNSGGKSLMDVHGAGAQRSDPKRGDPEDYPEGHGPQGDVVRIYNYVRLVCDTDATSEVEETKYEDFGFIIYPNPAKDYVEISFLSDGYASDVSAKISIFDGFGRLVLAENFFGFSARVDVSGLTPGAYAVRVVCGEEVFSDKLIVGI